MTYPLTKRQYYFLGFWLALLTFGLKVVPTEAEPCQTYNPIPLTLNAEVADTLSERDLPTGEGGFARDYAVQLEAGDQVAIDLLSEDFDGILILLASDGSTIAENDDGPDGSTNSLLFARITEPGKYIVRVRAFGETGGGKFMIKLTRLRAVKDGKGTQQ